MFNLIIRWFDWDDAQGSMPLGGVFEYAEQTLIDHFSDNGQPAFAQLIRLPCLLMTEGTAEEVCRIDTITCARSVGRDVTFDDVLDTDVPPLQ